jgi:hypothetical protein
VDFGFRIVQAYLRFAKIKLRQVALDAILFLFELGIKEFKGTKESFIP